jgi:TPR repeat protein
LYGEAFKGLLPEAEKGDYCAQSFVSCIYLEGLGVQKNTTQGFEWAKRAADQGYADSLDDLGQFLAGGVGTSKNLEEAIKAIKNAADQGYSKSQYNLGYCYEKGIGVKKDIDEAVKYFKLSAEQEFAASENELGNCYDMGLGVKQDKDLAIKWFEKAANQGNEEAIAVMANVKKFASKKDNPTQVDASKDSSQEPQGIAASNLQQSGTEWSKRYLKIKELSDKGDPDAMAIMSYWMRSGNIAGGIVGAEKLAKASADKNNPLGQFELGRIYVKLGKDGSTELFNKCIPILLEKVGKGDPEAQLRISKAYQCGYAGLPVDMRKSYEVVLKAAQDNNLMEDAHVSV